MYNEELELLIDAALADGELTEKEKQILFKKAQTLGIDLDEFEMVLDARLHKVRQASNAAPANSAPKSNKFGDVRKCPSCGAILQSFQTRCPDCGHEFSSVDAVMSAQRLFDSLQAAELRKTEQLAKQNEEKQRRLNELSERQNKEGSLVKLFGGSSRNERLDEEREDLIRELDKTYSNLEKKLNQEKANIIKNFPVPNAKEDLLELLAMATSNAYDNDGVVGYEEEVWIQKTDQIYQKIVACSDNDPQLLEKATNMIVPLMRRLPRQYRNFTKIPQSIKSKVDAELAAERERKKNLFLDIVKKYGIWGGPCLLVGIIFLFIENDVVLFIGLILIIAAIVAFILGRKEWRNTNF